MANTMNAKADLNVVGESLKPGIGELMAAKGIAENENM
jgi:hypothetical protein